MRYSPVTNEPFEHKFRRVLGHYPTGVCAITALEANGTPLGLIVGSFTSVSLDPPLIGFFPNKSSSSWPKIREIGRFCVNVLSDDQQHISRALAAKGKDKFKAIDYLLSPLGLPVICDSLVWIDCILDVESEAGDHLAVLGKVENLEILGSGNPMVFYKGMLCSIAP
jgi:flavin reductase (DIM6/NTAB) family NADH-FMN oxidoreductase RutF